MFVLAPVLLRLATSQVKAFSITYLHIPLGTIFPEVW